MPKPKKTASFIHFTERLKHFLIRSNPLHRSKTSHRQPDPGKYLIFSCGCIS